jgi:hypothetical protein
VIEHRFALLADYHQIFADYHQIYVACETGVMDFVAPRAAQGEIDGILAGAGFIAVATARNTTLPVVIAVLDDPPDTDLSAVDHVVECDLALPSGVVVVAGCTDYAPDAARLSLAPGLYRAQISTAGLSTLTADGLDGDDHYRIDLWLADPGGTTVQKRCHPDGPRPM